MNRKGIGGRPRIEFTDKEWRQIEQMAHIQCTGEEIAAVMGCSFDTLEKRVKEKYEMSFADWITQKKHGGNASLRRMQWTTAQSGNVTMQIFLGKNKLGQTDGNIKVTDEDGAIPCLVIGRSSDK